MSDQQLLSLIQTLIRSDLSTASIGVAIFLYLLALRKEDCEKFTKAKQATGLAVPYGFDDVSFIGWKMRLDMYVRVMFFVLLLMIVPPLVALFFMWEQNLHVTFLYHALIITTSLALFLILVTFGHLWWLSKHRALPPELRGMF